MIIRRRTYIKQFTSRYGYFMRNVNFSVGTISSYNSSSGEWTEKPVVRDCMCNIYTKCMQKETPVGNFPNSIRNDSTNQTCSNNNNKIVAAVGCTDGSTIIVATGKKLYRSTDGGNTWGNALCTWNSNSYISKNTGPIVWMDSTYYYILYVSLDASGGSNTYNRLKLFKYTISSGSTNTTTLQSQYYSGGGASTPYGTVYGQFYANKVSPKGQVMIYSKNTSSNWTFIIVDLVRGKVSGDINCPIEEQYSSGIFQCAGQWYNDGTTYGSFFFYTFNPQYGNYGALNKFIYYKAASSAFNSGASITKTDITNTLGRIVTDNYTYYASGTQIYQYPTILVCSCDQSYKNKLFFISGRDLTYYSAISIYLCKSNFSDIEKLPDLPASWKQEASGIEYPGDLQLGGIAGTCVSPDGNYGCIISGGSSIVYDITNKTYWGAYCFVIYGNDQIANSMGNYLSFMLPKLSL